MCIHIAIHKSIYSMCVRKVNTLYTCKYYWTIELILHTYRPLSCILQKLCMSYGHICTCLHFLYKLWVHSIESCIICRKNYLYTHTCVYMLTHIFIYIHICMLPPPPPVLMLNSKDQSLHKPDKLRMAPPYQCTSSSLGSWMQDGKHGNTMCDRRAAHLIRVLTPKLLMELLQMVVL